MGMDYRVKILAARHLVQCIDFIRRWGTRLLSGLGSDFIWQNCSLRQYRGMNRQWTKS